MSLPRPLLWLFGAVPTVVLGAGVVWGLDATPGIPALLGDAPPEIRAGARLTVDREALARIDLATVHEELVPDWVVSTGAIKRMQFRRIRAEAGQDPNLGALLDRMEVLFEADPVLHATELLGLVRTWNVYLGTAGEPWRLGGEVRIGDGGQFLLKSYRVVWDDGRVHVGDQTFDAEIRRRVDRTTLVDSWLGHMHDPADGVVVLLDRVTAFSLDQVWPMLDPALEPELDPISRAFAPAVRAEAAAWLTRDELAALAATAEDRYWMNRAADAIHGRHQCGSAFFVSRVPWSGMNPRDLATLQRTALEGEGSACPDVTETEAMLFAARTGHLRRVAGLHEALEHLVGLTASAVAVHEGRHAADDLALGGQSIPCVGCPADTTRLAALEGSAYAASFAHPDHGALSMYQACALDPDFAPEQASIVEFLARRMADGAAGCAAGARPDRVARAEALQREVFGRADRIGLDFPTSLPVSDEYGAP